MGKKNRKTKETEIAAFSYDSFIKYFLVFFAGLFLLLVLITPFLSTAKMFLVKNVISLLLKEKAPYIHPIPIYKNLSLSLPVFLSLFLSYQKLSKNKKVSTRKNIVIVILCLLLLWLLELTGNILEIVVTKLSITSFLPNFILTILLSIGSIGFPLLLWLIVFHPSFLDTIHNG